MTYFIVIHTHEYGKTVYPFKSKASFEDLNDKKESHIVPALSIDYEEHKDEELELVEIGTKEFVELAI